MYENHTIISEFWILGFYNLHGFRIPMFILFLIIYNVICLENLLIIVLVSTTLHLETPMYFILKNMSFAELLYTASFHPIMLHSLMVDRATISVTGCVIQLNTYGFSGNTKSFLYALLSYDRYLAISNPLRYNSLIDNRICFRLVIVFWITSFIPSCVMATLTRQLEFCGPNIIDHFYCEFSPLVALSCSDTTLVRGGSALISTLVLVFPFTFVIVSYIVIIYTIVKIPSAAGKRKAFSTSGSHLTMITISYGCHIIVYVLPASIKLPHISKGLSLMHIVVTPLINPIVYGLKNEDFHRAIKMKVSVVKKLYNY